MVGVPSSVVDKVKLEASGTSMNVTASATQEELDQIQKGVEDAMKNFGG